MSPGAEGAARFREDVVLTERAPAAVATAAPTPNQAAPAAPGASDETLLARILTSLEDDKAEDILSIGLQGKSEMADHMVVASGRSSRQVVAMAEHLADRLKQTTGRPVRMEGKDGGDWVLIDCGDVIVHLFRPEVREFYQLEKMWLSPEDQRQRTQADT